MDLGKHVLDKELLDRRGLRAGRVDDLILEIPDGHDGAVLPEPEVAAIVSGPMALQPILSAPMRWLARHVYRLLGLKDPRPVEIPWSDVTKIDVAVHMDQDRDGSGMTALAKAVDRRFIGHVPGA